MLGAIVLHSDNKLVVLAQLIKMKFTFEKSFAQSMVDLDQDKEHELEINPEK